MSFWQPVDQSFILDKKSEKTAHEACSDTAQTADEDQITNFATSCPEWGIKTELDIIFVTWTNLFADFVKASALAKKVCAIAEQANHHPRIVIEYVETMVD